MITASYTVPQIVCEGITAAGDNYVKIGGIGNFSVEKTFDCGQSFRFDPVTPPSIASQNAVCYRGISFGHDVTFCQTSNELTIVGASAKDYKNIWAHYLALDEDYDALDRMIINAMPTKQDRTVMESAVKCGAGIRILRQDPFECLISFIVSQNNNIPRIKKIITALCEKYGENGAFPTPEALYNAGEAEIFALRTGFRAGYIFDAARQVLEGSVDLSAVDAACYEDAAEMLCKIKGVGPKVSACVLLFGFGKTEAFPIDVWMKRSLARHFPNGFDHTSLGRSAGIAQQYLFYYERWLGGEAN